MDNKPELTLFMKSETYKKQSVEDRPKKMDSIKCCKAKPRLRSRSGIRYKGYVKQSPKELSTIATI